MTVPIQCSCGQLIQANPSLAGQRIPCPRCGLLLTVPPPAPSAAPAPRGSAQTLAADERQQTDRTWLPIVGAVLAILLLCTVLMWALLIQTGAGTGLGSGVGAGAGDMAGNGGGQGKGEGQQDTGNERMADAGPSSAADTEAEDSGSVDEGDDTEETTTSQPVVTAEREHRPPMGFSIAKESPAEEPSEEEPVNERSTGPSGRTGRRSGAGGSSGGGSGVATISGVVIDAVTGNPLAGAAVKIKAREADYSTTTDSAGHFTFREVPSGQHILIGSLEGYIENSVTLAPRAGNWRGVTIGLPPVQDKVAIVLSWGRQPADLDLHLSGPDGRGVGGKFHISYQNKSPIRHAFLDLDDTSSFGPETITISPLTSGRWERGTYQIWVHNFSRHPEFNISGAEVNLFVRDRQIGHYSVKTARGDRSMDLWRVVRFHIARNGAVSKIKVLQNFRHGNQNSLQ